jgi:hypothetical protein
MAAALLMTDDDAAAIRLRRRLEGRCRLALLEATEDDDGRFD